ncbi:TNT domain-containing protein [Nocardiopsis lambiniae]|uniref:TNT domain-containing protein n=1 Tax=Nocardiopsis lambiniae TaxID=3075539 RepID=A0ABU2M2F5_9ACTN|nr:TNT domain-containing protein [Nocardiopsis sp. DSM 44743]MDT0326828.1 TNT domain-containing protein [Nocardiopsis sp. DSM 44743]
MARDYDSQLLESVAVRRQRLREAVLFGGQRTRRRLDENITKVMISACLAAVICGGTVGWSFVSHQLGTQRVEREQAASGPTTKALPATPGAWVGTEVTFDQLRAELDAAGVPESLYVLPGDPRPEAGTIDSYYLVTEDADGYPAVSVMDHDQGRPGPGFSTEDETARWLHRELATTEAAPEPLTAAEEAEMAETSAELVEEVRGNLEQRSGGSYLHTLEPGDVLDAFGQESGRHLNPDGTPFAERGLPAYVRTDADGEPLYHRYRVIHPFQVTATTAPADGDATGGGIRFTLDTAGFGEVPPVPTIRWLIGNGYVERVAVTDMPG